MGCEDERWLHTSRFTHLPPLQGGSVLRLQVHHLVSTKEARLVGRAAEGRGRGNFEGTALTEGPENLD